MSSLVWRRLSVSSHLLRYLRDAPWEPRMVVRSVCVGYALRVFPPGRLGIQRRWLPVSTRSTPSSGDGALVSLRLPARCPSGASPHLPLWSSEWWAVPLLPPLLPLPRLWLTRGRVLGSMCPSFWICSCPAGSASCTSRSSRTGSTCSGARSTSQQASWSSSGGRGPHTTPHPKLSLLRRARRQRG